MSTTPKNPWESVAAPMQAMWTNAMQQYGKAMQSGGFGAPMPATEMMGMFQQMVPTLPNVQTLQAQGSQRIPSCYYGQGRCQ